MEIAMINDAIVPMMEATMNANDRGVFFGDGVYEVVLGNNGRLFKLQEHMERFERSLGEMDMLDRVDLDEIRNRIELGYRKAPFPLAVIYFHITRGTGPRSHDYHDDWQPTFYMTVRDYGPKRPSEIKAITHPDWRWSRCDIKSLNLLANVLAKHAATRQGAYEALLIDRQGLITEATASSVLMVKEGALWTAPLSANILPGITRQLLLTWAPELGLEVREESFTVEQASQAEELLITGTGNQVMSILQLDDHPIAGGQAGAYTQRFQDRLTETINQS